MLVTAFLPCRSGSQRVPQKNTKPFAGNREGLLGVKLGQLAACEAFDRVVVSTNDEIVIAIAERWAGDHAKIVIDRRPEHLCLSSTSTDELIGYVPTIIDEGAVVWTHVTSPLVDEHHYGRMVQSYNEALAAGSHDSLMTVTALRTFLWTDEAPVNYDRNVEKWPRTQTLKPLYMVNSAAFVIEAGLMRDRADRIGDRPLMFELDEIESFDVDWQEQFAIAEALYQMARKQGGEA